MITLLLVENALRSMNWEGEGAEDCLGYLFPPRSFQVASTERIHKGCLKNVALLD